MSAKKWTVSFTLLILLCLLFIMGTNYFVDPFGYFRAQGGNDYSLDESYYLREIKAQQIKNHASDYDAYLIGGSKAGAIRTEKLQEMNGYRYYNAWVLSGNFQDYYYYTKYVIDNCNPKKILLHISSSEIKSYDREDAGDMYVIPAEIMGTSKTEEAFEFLFKNLSASVDELKRDFTKEPLYPMYPSGERNLKKYYSYMKEHTDSYYDFLFTKNELQKGYNVLEQGAPDKTKVVTLSIDRLKEIKKLCDKKNIEFQVIIGSVFIGELVGLEGESFYSYLEQIVQITGGVWNFNTYNDFALNPYNYYNVYHYNYETADLMIDTIMGKESPKDFGIYLTMDNIGSYINSRREKMKDIRNYYKKTGTLPLQSFHDSSNYKKDEKLSFTDMAAIQ